MKVDVKITKPVTKKMKDMEPGEWGVVVDGNPYGDEGKLVYCTYGGDVELIDSTGPDRWTGPSEIPVEILPKGSRIKIKV